MRDEKAIVEKKEEILNIVRLMGTAEELDDPEEFLTRLGLAGAELVGLEKQ